MQAYRMAPVAVLPGAAGGLAACQMGAGTGFFRTGGPRAAPAHPASARAAPVRVEPAIAAAAEDEKVEAPEIFHVEKAGLRGAPPDAAVPGGVPIRNSGTGRSAAGTLLRREGDPRGRRLRVSLKAAAQIGLPEGTPSGIAVSALRRAPARQAADRRAEAPGAEAVKGGFVHLATPESADGAAARGVRFGKAGLSAEIRAPDPGGRRLWRVVAGPAKTGADRTALIGAVRGPGRDDACAVNR
ncbi:hypothetical protein [Rhodovulum sp. YEN HP10]|uniref:hypothetical protein n=1 Tax=Rhodovulum sp. HP10 TaxID=3387397 RepID=UPI0039E1688D